MKSSERRQSTQEFAPSAKRALDGGPEGEASRSGVIDTREPRGVLMPPPSARPRRELLILNLAGSQAQMGEQHGRLLRSVGGFQASIDYYPALPERILSGSGGALSGLAWRLGRPVLDALLLSLELRRPAAYRRRSREFARALGIAPGFARFLQVMDVAQNIVGLAGRFRLGPFARAAGHVVMPACSTLMVWDRASRDGELRHARNFDFPGISVWDRAPAVVFCSPDQGLKYGFVSTRGADAPGVTGFNEAGLSLTAHTRFHRDVSFAGVGVVDLGHDIVRRAETISDAVKIARERRVASSWGLAVSSAREHSAVVLETSASGVAVVAPRDDHLTCANRYRHRDMMRGELTATTSWAVHSDSREQRMTEIVEAARGRGGLSTSELEDMLGDHAESVSDGTERASGGVLAQATTVQSVVFEPESQNLQVSVGACPTGWGPYASVPLRWTDTVGGEVVPGSRDGHGARGRRFSTPEARQAYMHFVDATRLDAEHRYDAALEHLERAMRLDPQDSTYAFLAGVLRLRAGDTAGALRRFEAGLRQEACEYRGGQLRFWAARACDRLNRGAQAAGYRMDLLATTISELEERRRVAAAEAHRGWRGDPGKIRVNFVLVDAF